MVIKIKVKNADKYVLLDHEVFEALNSIPLFQEYHLFDHIREHSSGVPVFQKYLNNTVDGKLKVETIYLAHFIAKKYIPQPESEKRMFLNFLNADKLDLRLRNMKWESMKMVKRTPRDTNHGTVGLGHASPKVTRKTRRARRKKLDPENHVNRLINTTPLEIDEINLLPAHFAPLRKKMTRKVKSNGAELPFENDIPRHEQQKVEELIPQEGNA